MMLNRSLVLLAAIAIAAMTGGPPASAQQSGLASEQRTIRHLAARLRDHADALEREWRVLKADIDEMEQRRDLAGLGCLFLGRACPGNDAPSQLTKNLRLTVEASPPCETLDISECRPEELFKTVPKDGSQQPDSGRTYLQCIAGHYDWAVARKAKDFRVYSEKAVGASDLNGAIRVVAEASQDVSVVPPEGEKKRSCTPPNQIDPRTIPSFDVSVEWGAKCDSGNRVLDDGSAELYHPTVGALLTPSRKLGSQAFCTGTLIAPNAVLTAAHCFCQTGARGDPGSPFFPTHASCRRGTFYRDGRPVSPLDPRPVSVFFQHAGEFKAREILLHPEFRWVGLLPRADLAIVLLDRSVPGIVPAAIDTIRTQRYVRTGISVGFGFATRIDVQGRPANDNLIVERTGLKFAARIAPSPCLYVERARRLICWDRRAEFGGTRLGSTCNGDSGGPLFMDVNGQTYLTGVTSAGSPGCALGTRAYDIEVFAFRKWIADVLRDEPAPPPEIALKNGRQRKCRYYGLGNSGTETVKIEGARDRRLRVSLNCQSIGRPIGLKLRREEQARDKVVIDCGNRTAMGLSCDVAVRPGQEWKIDFNGGNAPGCQIVATTFEGNQ